MARHTIIVVGTSAGGVEALCELNKDLPNVGESPNRRARSQAVARNSGADLADTPRNARTPVRAEPFGAACRGLPALPAIEAQRCFVQFWAKASRNLTTLYQILGECLNTADPSLLRF